MGRENYRSLYGDLTKLKDQAGVQESATTYDTALWQLLLANSEAIDMWLGRRIAPITTTRYFDGPGTFGNSTKRTDELWTPDLISITTLKEDTAKDLAYATTWATTDYWKWPYNAEPTKHWGRPYEKLRVRSSPGTKADFKAGEQRFQIVGVFGYRQFTEASGSTTAEAVDAAETAIDVTLGTDFQPGQTIIIDTEQMLVVSISSNTLTVVKGLNGTTDAAHATATAISILRWPAPIERACIINTARMYARAPIFEPFYVDVDLDSDVRQMLEPYRRQPSEPLD